MTLFFLLLPVTCYQHVCWDYEIGLTEETEYPKC